MQPTATPRLVAVHEDDAIRSGFHVARRFDWEDKQRLEVVWLDVWHEGETVRLNVWRCGGSKPEDPQDWEFQMRITGIHAPHEMIDLEATRH